MIKQISLSLSVTSYVQLCVICIEMIRQIMMFYDFGKWGCVYGRSTRRVIFVNLPKWHTICQDVKIT